MGTGRRSFDLDAELRALKPTPRLEFAAELDARAAARFPRKGGFWRPSWRIPVLRAVPRRRLLVPAGACAVLAIAIATGIVAGSKQRSNLAARPELGRSNRATPGHEPTPPIQGQFPHGASPRVESSTQSSEVAPSGSDGSGAAAGSAAGHRDVERSTEIGLLADPEDVAADSSRVFSAVHDVNGIVLHSTTTQGRHAGAHFDLLIPSARLGDAMAAFSAIDQVRTRHESTADITASTVTTGERLRESRARIDGLLSQLAAAETESETTVLEGRLERERRREAVLSARLTRLHQRTTYSRVDLRIESGSSPDSPGGWGAGKAFGDAGHILSVAAGVTLIGLAVLAPLALLALLVWLARRAWLRHARNRALA